MKLYKRFSVIPIMLTIILLLTTVLTGSVPVNADEPPNTEFLHQLFKDDPRMFVAANYAQFYHVTLKEARLRLDLQDIIGKMDGRLTDNEKETFGGLWIEHTPTFRVVVLFTSQGNETIASYIPEELKGIVEVRSVETSLAELEALQDTTTKRIENLGIPVESAINVYNNRIKYFVVDRAKIDAAIRGKLLDLSPKIDLITVDTLSTKTIDVFGGLYLQDAFGWLCTSGFGVEWPDGARGVTTAGHVGNKTLYYSPYPNVVTLNYIYGLDGSDYDVQVHFNQAATVTNEIQVWGDGSTRSITGTVSRNDQSVGAYVEKFGMTTGYTAGHISYKTFDPGTNYSATFIYVDNTAGYSTLCDFGDSGGPWFKDNNAYGIISGKVGDGDAYYMAINYISGIGVSVLTAP